MSKTTTKKQAREQARNLLTDTHVTIMTGTGKGRTPHTFPIPTMDDLPRRLRRTVRHIAGKHFVGRDRRQKMDAFGIGQEIGELIINEFFKLDIDFDAENLPVAEQDSQDSLTALLGIRVLNGAEPEAADGEDGGDPNASEGNPNP